MAIKGKTWLQLAALVLLLGIFPAASWYYLNSGLQYRKAAMSDLQEHGHFPLEGWTQVDGHPLATAFLEKKMILANWISASSPVSNATALGERLIALHKQFDERDDLVFMTLVVGDSSELAMQSANLVESYPIRDDYQQVFVALDDAGFARLQSGPLSRVPALGMQAMGEHDYFLLTDTSAMVRRVYDLTENGEVKRLVEHIALLLPLKKDRDLIFRREVEK